LVQNVAGGNYEKSLIATTLKAIGTGIDKIKGSDKPREFTLTPTYKDNLGMSVGGTATMTPSEKPVNPWEKPVREKVPKFKPSDIWKGAFGEVYKTPSGTVTYEEKRKDCR